MSIFVDHKALKHALKKLKDVLIVSPADAEVLTYEAVSALWKNKAPTLPTDPLTKLVDLHLGPIFVAFDVFFTTALYTDVIIGTGFITKALRLIRFMTGATSGNLTRNYHTDTHTTPYTRVRFGWSFYVNYLTAQDAYVALTPTTSELALGFIGIGFHINNGNLYAYNGNGVAYTQTFIKAVGSMELLQYEVKMCGTDSTPTSIEFYRIDVDSAQKVTRTLVATHTTNIPSMAAMRFAHQIKTNEAFSKYLYLNNNWIYWTRS